jgi:hypothetical protein
MRSSDSGKVSIRSMDRLKSDIRFICIDNSNGKRAEAPFAVEVPAPVAGQGPPPAGVRDEPYAVQGDRQRAVRSRRPALDSAPAALTAAQSACSNRLLMPDSKMTALSADNRTVGVGYWWPWAHHHVWN